MYINKILPMHIYKNGGIKYQDSPHRDGRRLVYKIGINKI